MTTTWNATATVTQSEHVANAYASFVLRTGSSPVTQIIAMATSYAALRSAVFTASAWLSPGSGGSGRLNGKTHVGSAAWPVGASGLAFGTRTRASSGRFSVGSGADRGSTVLTSPPFGGELTGAWCLASANGAAARSRSVPSSYGWIRWGGPGAGHP